MKKLTNALREEICQRVLRNTFKDRAQALRNEEPKVAMALYEALVPEENREALAKTPKHFLTTTDTIRFGVRNKGDKLRYLGSVINGSVCMVVGVYLGADRLRLDKSVPVPPDTRYCAFELTEEDHAAPIAQYDEWAERVRALEQEYEQVKEKATGVLNSATTLKRLLEVWPDVKKFVPDDALFDSAKMVPAIIVEDLNAMIEKAKGTFVAKPTLVDPAAVVNALVATSEESAA